MNRDVWGGRRVLVTGHTGFKGAWLTAWLEDAGAEVTGVSLAAPRGSLHRDIDDGDAWAHNSVCADLRSTDLDPIVNAAQPEVVFHLAAQALVRSSYTDPEATWSTNVIGTLRLLDALRRCDHPRVVLTTTTDKVYGSANRAFSEDDPLVATDPYSASKVGQEAVVASFAHSCADRGRYLVGRAGNVIGGGDDGLDRLIPDAVRACRGGEPLVLRYPDSVRPWQHVLEPLAGYLAYAEHSLAREDVPPALNFGPNDAPATVAEVARRFLDELSDGKAEVVTGPTDPERTESAYLSIDAARAGAALGWKPRLTFDEAISWSARWYRNRADGASPRDLVIDQIHRYEERIR